VPPVEIPTATAITATDSRTIPASLCILLAAITGRHDSGGFEEFRQMPDRHESESLPDFPCK